jgi:hypothetical protein
MESTLYSIILIILSIGLILAPVRMGMKTTCQKISQGAVGYTITVSNRFVHKG